MQAVQEARRTGLLELSDEKQVKESQEKHRIAVVGCGRGGAAILEMLNENEIVEICGAVDSRPDAPGIMIARRHGIPILTEINDILGEEPELIIDVTGSKKVYENLQKVKGEKTDVMGGLAARLMWKLAEERRKRYEEREKMLKEHENLYHLGLIIENIDSMKDAGYAILDYATKLTHMSAGSLAVFDERNEELVMVASKGFSEKFKKFTRWPIEKDGLISKIFNQNHPLFISNIGELQRSTPVLIKEGVRSVLASSLTVDGRIVGLVFVADFNKKAVRSEDVSIFSLMTVYSALTIERVKAIEEMRRLSIVDGLTGLHNHRYLMEEMEREVERSVRYDSNFSILILDVDNFKSYNDKFGHLDGNKVLKNLSVVLKNNARSTDTVGRFGGEEFLIITPELKKNDACKYANRLLGLIRKEKFPNRVITASCGVSSYPEDGKSITDLIEAADRRLYQAKELGKDNVCS